MDAALGARDRDPMRTQDAMTDTNRPLAVVTGAGRSLGRAIAERLHADGWSIAVTDLDHTMAETVAAGLHETGATAKAFQLDVASAEGVGSAFAAIGNVMGLPSALVNNAGIYPDHSILDMPVEAWDSVMAVNLRGTFLCTQAFARARAEPKGGAIVNLASAAAYSSRVGASHYSTSKAGVVMFTKAAAQELGPLGIRVNAVAP